LQTDFAFVVCIFNIFERIDSRIHNERNFAQLATAPDKDIQGMQ
jgi:hypothetical protein